MAVNAGPDDGHAWEFHVDLTADQVKQKLDECRQRNWSPTLVYRHRTQGNKFAVTLVDNPHKEPWEFNASLSLEDYEKKLQENKARGWWPEYVQSWIADKAPVYSAVWVGDLKVDPAVNVQPEKP